MVSHEQQKIRLQHRQIQAAQRTGRTWMLLPDIQAMKHMKAMFLTGAVARAYSICRQADQL